MAFEELSAANEALAKQEQQTSMPDGDTFKSYESYDSGPQETEDRLSKAGGAIVTHAIDVNEYYRKILPNGLVSPPRGRTSRGRR